MLFNCAFYLLFIEKEHQQKGIQNQVSVCVHACVCALRCTVFLKYNDLFNVNMI